MAQSSTQRGTIDLVAFMPTPFDGDGIDTAAVKRQMQHYRDHDVQVGLMGGLGEFYALSHQESDTLMKASVDGVEGAVKVYAALGFATREAVRLAVSAADAGCSAVVVNPPYYVAPSPRGMAEHVRAITEASGLEAVLYSSKLLAITDDYLAELVEVPGFRGVKDELSSAEEFAARVRTWGERVDFWVVGEHIARPYVEAGAAAVTTALANVAPQASRAHLAGTDSTGQLADLVLESVRMIGAEPGASASVVKEMIAAVSSWPTGVRGPQSTLSAEHRDHVHAVVRRIVGGWGG